MKISIKKIAKCVIFFSIIAFPLISELGMPTFILYINDLFLVILSVYSIKHKFWNVFGRINFRLFNIWVLFAIGLTTIGLVGNVVSPHMMLWGLRNTYRGVIFLIACVIYLDLSDVKKIFRFFIKIQYLNFAFGLYQYYILGLYQDRLGGIFGHGNGNALCIFCVIVCTYSLLTYLNERTYLFHTVFCFISSLILATMAEEKLLYVELAVVVFLSLILCKKKYLKYVFIPVIILCLPFLLDIISIYAPDTVEMFMSTETITEYLSASWDGSYYIPRLGALSFITKNVFKNNLFNTIFGYGMGNCDTSNFSFLISENYAKYGYMNYRWIFSQWTMMELGYTGVILFLALFMIIVFFLLRYRESFSGEEHSYICSSIIIALCCILTMWFNNTLKVDSSYIPYFATCAGVICVKTRKGVKL